MEEKLMNGAELARASRLSWRRSKEKAMWKRLERSLDTLTGSEGFILGVIVGAVVMIFILKWN